MPLNNHKLNWSVYSTLHIKNEFWGVCDCGGPGADQTPRLPQASLLTPRELKEQELRDLL